MGPSTTNSNTSDGPLPFLDLPIIDIVQLCGRSGDVNQSTESQKLVDAFTNVGFCLLTNMTGIGRLYFRTFLLIHIMQRVGVVIMADISSRNYVKT